MDEINRYKERLQIALTAAKICIFEVDLLQQLYTYFENAEVIFGISGEKILKDVQPFSKLEPVEYRKAASAYFSHPEDEAVIEKAFKDMNYLQRPMPHCTRRRRKREFSYIIMSNSGNSKEGLFFFLFLFQGNTNHDFLTK